jgi:hypothetical protein
MLENNVPKCSETFEFCQEKLTHKLTGPFYLAWIDCENVLQTHLFNLRCIYGGKSCAKYILLTCWMRWMGLCSFLVCLIEHVCSNKSKNVLQCIGKFYFPIKIQTHDACRLQLIEILASSLWYLPKILTLFNFLGRNETLLIIFATNKIGFIQK